MFYLIVAFTLGYALGYTVRGARERARRRK